ncbi:B-cell antigen receptor complex-associated protein beta chain isoform X2 [Eleutherodactylus coqui]|uniref:B-cell antigen receptor complex-associated protein beta chain isoform X2 n=1 Tax=Eleutherodactylus coqui TaxID=57060 RepID=UPI003462129E
MTTSGAVLCALCIAVLVFDQGCCDKRNSSSETSAMLQNPRFVLLRKGLTVNLQCGCRREFPPNCSTFWYLGQQNGAVINYLENDHRTTMHNNCLTIRDVQKKDNGVYFCEHKTAGERKQLPCGTELMVVAYRTPETVKAKNSMKDTIIVIQMFLILLFTVVPITLVREMKRKRSLKIEDHTYEGLEAYQAATYEDIQTVRVLAAKTMEGEHPCIE